MKRPVLVEWLLNQWKYVCGNWCLKDSLDPGRSPVESTMWPISRIEKEHFLATALSARSNHGRF